MNTNNNNKEKRVNNRISLEVTTELSVNVMPNEAHEFLMTTKEVAAGYGVSRNTIRRHQMEHPLELIEGKHYIKGCEYFEHPKKGCNIGAKPNNIQSHQILWTKRGIVRLGFFIKSERARMFRDWAEDLIICLDNQKNLFGEIVPQPSRPTTPKRYHNFVTRDRLLDIMADVCQIEDKELRLRLSNKLNNIK